MARNPVMFVVEVVSLLASGFWVQALMGRGEAPAGFIGQISLWLWFTVLFASFAEALAEGRGKAQADALRRMRKQTQAKRLPKGYLVESHGKPERGGYSLVSSTELRRGDLYWLRRETSFLPMEKLWRELLLWMKAPSPEKARL
jgi:K+-transporting ATPase ATPase B chain